MKPAELVELVKQLSAAGPNVAVIVDAAKLLSESAPAPELPPAARQKFVINTARSSGQVKVRPEPSPAVGGPTLPNGTIVEDLARDKKAYDIEWKFVRTLDGVIQGYVEEENLKPA